MRFIYLLSLVTTASANALLQPSPATSDPTITPPPRINVELLRKQTNNRFMGWVSYSFGWSTRQCDVGGTLYQSGDYWRCCATTVASCNIPVGCISGSLIYAIPTGTVSRRTLACTDVYDDPEDKSFTLCNTGFMFENTVDSSPQTNVFCGVSSVNWSYYRVKPDETTPISSPTSSPTSPKSTPANPTPATPTPVNPTDPASPIIPPQPVPKSKSKAWIAGIVIGPLIGVALIALFALFLIKKRKKKAAATNVPPPANFTDTAPPYNPVSPQQSYQQPIQQNGAGGFVPFGVSEQKHSSWMSPPPGSPQPHSAVSPMTQHSSMYFDPATINQNAGYYPPPAASPPPHINAEYYKQPAQFTSELEASTPPAVVTVPTATTPVQGPPAGGEQGLAPVEVPANPPKN